MRSPTGVEVFAAAAIVMDMAAGLSRSRSSLSRSRIKSKAGRAAGGEGGGTPARLAFAPCERPWGAGCRRIAAPSPRRHSRRLLQQQSPGQAARTLPPGHFAVSCTGGNRSLSTDAHVHLAIHRHGGLEVLGGLHAIAGAPAQLAEAEAGVRGERAHPELLPQGEGLAVVRSGGLQ